ncbi:MAG: hypothetical protein AAFX06_29160 [Planctomycetota bacterium]
MSRNTRLQLQNLEGRLMFAGDVMSLQMIPNVGTGRYDFVAPAEIQTVRPTAASTVQSPPAQEVDMVFTLSHPELFAPN